MTLSGSGGAQAIVGAYPVNFNGLTVSNSSGVTLDFDVTVAGTLTFTIGKVTTGANVLSVADGGSVSRTSGHVVGNLQKYIPTGDPSATFEVGDSANYTPITVSFTSVTAAGELTASTTIGDHPGIGSSSLDPGQTVNRYWSLANSGIALASYGVTFDFVGGDVDAAADPDYFVVQRYTASAWSAVRDWVAHGDEHTGDRSDRLR